MQSKITTVKKGTKSIRVSIPPTVKEMMNLNSGDIIEWTPDIKDGEVIFYIKKV